MALAVTGSLAVVGYLPTVRFGGRDAVAAMAAGCGVSLLASFVGAVPVVRALAGDRTQLPMAVLASTAVRFLAVLALVVPLALSGWVERTVFVVWTGISYLVLLMADTWLAVRSMDGPPRNRC
jgi:predicted LPLAT superfamily acyltransferase